MIIQIKAEEKGICLLEYNNLVMGKLEHFLAGVKILEEVESPINGKLTIVRDLAWGVHIKGGGLTQSGGVVNKVWNTSLKETRKRKSTVKKCLILGLGGGGVTKIIKKHWKRAVITGVEIDPIMINLGEKHMGLKESGVKVVNDDAMKFVEGQTKKKERYDLILVDMYVGDTIPEKFTTASFYKMTKKLLENNGVIIVNRLYYGKKRKLADRAHEGLKRVFPKITTVFPEANIMYICSNNTPN
jgi:hypothetical protein